MRWLLELPVALLLKRILGRSRPVPPAATPARCASRGMTAPRRPPLALAALGAGALGFALLVVVDVWFVRVLAVLLLFVFIVTGVFAIASPALLDDDEETAP